MIASPISARIDAACLRAEVPATQKGLLALAGQPDLQRLSQFLGDIYDVVPVRNESQLLATLEARPVQAVMINAEPGRTKENLQVCSRLKSSPRFAHLPIIIIIARNDHPARLASLEAGADAFLETPLSGNYLRALIRNILANRLRWQQHGSHPVSPHHHETLGRPSADAFLQRVNSFIAEHLPDIYLDVHTLARGMNISRPTLYRKIKDISQLTPNQLITSIRINKAAELLSTGNNKIYEIAKKVGFNSRSNFGKAFLKQFGMTPKEYQQKGQK